jgi:hypothetical protein
MIRGRVIVVAKALSPIHHGGELAGNVSMFRKQDVYVHGSKYSLPYISGNSIKSANRRASVAFAKAAMELETLTRAEVNLLRSGGSMTKSGPAIKLDAAREVSRKMPALGLHGYAAGNAMQESMLAVDFFEPLCWETRDKYAEVIAKHVADADRHMCEEPATELLKTYSEYARDGSRDREGFGWLEEGEATQLAAQIADPKAHDKDPYRPMPHSFECLIPGTVLVGGYTFGEGITEDELQAWRAGIVWASEGVADDGGLIMRVGGKGARGFGKLSVHLHGYLAKGIEPVQYHSHQDLIPSADPDNDLMAFAARLKAQRLEARKAMQEVLS